MELPQRRLKLVILGESSTGKTSLAIRFVKKQFFEITEPTIGAGFLVGKVGKASFEIWDTAGSERYRSLAPMYFRGARCALIAFDLTSQDSFDKVSYWVEQVRDQTQCVVCLVGTKADLTRQVTFDQAKEFADSNHLGYFETSAKTGENVEAVFEWFETQVGLGVAEGEQAQIPATSSSVNVAGDSPTSPTTRGGCC